MILWKIANLDPLSTCTFAPSKNQILSCKKCNSKHFSFIFKENDGFLGILKIIDI